MYNQQFYVVGNETYNSFDLATAIFDQTVLGCQVGGDVTFKESAQDAYDSVMNILALYTARVKYLTCTSVIKKFTKGDDSAQVRFDANRPGCKLFHGHKATPDWRPNRTVRIYCMDCLDFDNEVCPRVSCLFFGWLYKQESTGRAAIDATRLILHDYGCYRHPSLEYPSCVDPGGTGKLSNGCWMFPRNLEFIIGDVFENLIQHGEARFPNAKTLPGRKPDYYSRRITIQYCIAQR